MCDSTDSTIDFDFDVKCDLMDSTRIELNKKMNREEERKVYDLHKSKDYEECDLDGFEELEELKEEDVVYIHECTKEFSRFMTERFSWRNPELQQQLRQVRLLRHQQTYGYDDDDYVVDDDDRYAEAY